MSPAVVDKINMPSRLEEAVTASTSLREVGEIGRGGCGAYGVAEGQSCKIGQGVGL